GDVDNYLRVEVKAVNGAGTSSAADSAATAQVTAAAAPVPTNDTAPSISGTTEDGQTLTADQGQWSNSPTSYTYQWQTSSDGTSWSDINGETGSTYDVQVGDVGNQIRVEVVAVNAGGSSTPADSDPVTITSSGG